jgi:hypothetical protein
MNALADGKVLQVAIHSDRPQQASQSLERIQIRSGKDAAPDGGKMTRGNSSGQDEADFEGWLKEADGTLHLWPLQSFACGMTSQGIPVMRINFLYPPGHPIRPGTLQLHMSPQQARLLGTALLSAVGALA